VVAAKEGVAARERIIGRRRALRDGILLLWHKVNLRSNGVMNIESREASAGLYGRHVCQGSRDLGVRQGLGIQLPSTKMEWLPPWLE
jgi:hypothetical protein